MGSLNQQPEKRRPQTQYVKQNEKTEKGKNPPDQTNEEEIGNLPEKEFKLMIVKMIQNRGNRRDKIQETFNKT